MGGCCAHDNFYYNNGTEVIEQGHMHLSSWQRDINATKDDHILICKLIQITITLLRFIIVFGGLAIFHGSSYSSY